MSIVSGIVVYMIIWWVVIFAVLPWGVNPETSPQPGHDPGAPSRTWLLQKFLITTVISGIIWGIVYKLIIAGALSFHN
jgi:predicted secreted protein